MAGPLPARRLGLRIYFLNDEAPSPTGLAECFPHADSARLQTPHEREELLYEAASNTLGELPGLATLDVVHSFEHEDSQHLAALRARCAARWVALRVSYPR